MARQLKPPAEMCPKCYRPIGEHTTRERRRCLGTVLVLETAAEPATELPSVVDDDDVAHGHTADGVVAVTVSPEPVPAPEGLSIEDVRQAVAEALPEEHPDSDMSRAGILLLSAFQVGPNTKALRVFTGLPLTFITTASFYARHCGIWQRRGNRWDTIVCDWEEPDPIGYVAFVADCMVAAGRIVRETGVDKDGNPAIRYRMRMLNDYARNKLKDLEEIPWDLVANPDAREQRRLTKYPRPRPG